ncbi:MAG: hypothetical protein H6629_12220 [Calditrichae bacterium]|nr:hypothetical protein [Calditrichia bacterium]
MSISLGASRWLAFFLQQLIIASTSLSMTVSLSEMAVSLNAVEGCVFYGEIPAPKKHPRRLRRNENQQIFAL